jgi:transposase-like protein
MEEDLKYIYMYYDETEEYCPYCQKELSDLKATGSFNDFYRCPKCHEDFRVIRYQRD